MSKYDGYYTYYGDNSKSDILVLTSNKWYRKNYIFRIKRVPQDNDLGTVWNMHSTFRFLEEQCFGYFCKNTNQDSVSDKKEYIKSENGKVIHLPDKGGYAPSGTDYNEKPPSEE